MIFQKILAVGIVSVLFAGTLFSGTFPEAVFVPAAVENANPGEYAVLVAPEYFKDKKAMSAVKKFAARRGALKFVYAFGDERTLLKKLKKQRPRYIAVIAPPQKINRVFLQKLNQISRKIDPEEDDRIDAIVGVLTADSSENLAKVLAPFPQIELTRAIGTSNFDLERFDRAFVMLDWGGTQKFYTRKDGKTELKELADPSGAVTVFCDEYNEIVPQYFLSASHATEFNLEMPFSHGMIVPAAGGFWALPESEMRRHPLGGFVPENHKKFIPSDDPKIWIAAGNCLIGDAAGNPNSMVVTALSRYGFRQFVGYTVPSWFGRGWEIHRHFFDGTPAMQVGQAWLFCMENTLENLPKNLKKTEVELQAGGFSGPDTNALAEKIARAGTPPTQELVGNLHDRDTIAFYGDPICPVKFKNKPTDIRLAARGRSRELTVTPAAGTQKVPLCYWFPERADTSEAPIFTRVLNDGGEQKINPENIFTENFVILRKDYDFSGDKALKIEWKTKK